MNAHAVWAWTDRAGLEHCVVRSSIDGVDVDGLVVVDWDGVPLEVRYQFKCDRAWRFVGAHVRAVRGNDARAIMIDRPSRDTWRIDGEIAPHLAGCDDVDLMASPFTNTLPVRRLALRTAEPQRLDVAWIRLPDLDVVRARQEYERLDSTSHPFARRVLFRSVDSGFTAELDLDRDGLVIDYPPYWKRRGE
jgi:uncharacterized protein